ncbi:MAG: glycerate kinase [Chlorobi bacterium]|nr:glycerate kinase [Chlorobiota bacterium]
MRILCSPYTFKGTLSASEAARAIGAGIERRRADATIGLLPLADGGTGTLDALIAANGGEILSMMADDPLGVARPVRWGISERRAILEAAECIPLAGVPRHLRDPSRLGTAGLGAVILAALAHRPESLAIGLGDTATHDCGLGIGSALGYRFLDGTGGALAPVGTSLARLASIIPPDVSPNPHAVPVHVLCDVLNPLLGPDGAARCFASQKGADAATVDLLEEGSARFAEVAARDLGRSVADIPGAGAAGGLGAGLAAFLGAELRGGGAAVLDALRFNERLAGIDLVITGEGRVDRKTLLGKGVGLVIERSRAAGVPVLVIAGRIDGDSALRSMSGVRLLELGGDGEIRPFDTLAGVVAKGLDGALREFR